MLFEELAQTMNSLNEGFAHALLGSGTPAQQAQLAESLRSFANNINARAYSSNLQDIPRIKTAIDGVNALLNPEPADTKAAKSMVDALQARFSMLKGAR